jgi:hypothetical protein
VRTFNQLITAGMAGKADRESESFNTNGLDDWHAMRTPSLPPSLINPRSEKGSKERRRASAT